jgi:methionine-rich copper-binding protein CopC
MWALRVLSCSILLLGGSFVDAPQAAAHAFLDHAEPRVGSTVRTPPNELRLSFTQELEPAFSTVQVQDESGAKVDRGDVKVDADDATLLRVSLNPLPPGTYKVIWRVVSVDTHPTEGDFTFQVAP